MNLTENFSSNNRIKHTISQLVNCKVKSAEVEHVECPYARDIFGSENMVNLCPTCYDARLEDI